MAEALADIKARTGSVPTIRYFDLMMIVDNEAGLVTEFPQNMTSEAAEYAEGDLFNAVVPVASGADPVEPVANFGYGLQIARFRGTEGLARRLRQIPGVEIPLRIKRSLRDHERVCRLGKRCRATLDLFPLSLRFGRQIVLSLFVDHYGVDSPDHCRRRCEHMLHEGLHVDIGLEGRQRISALAQRWRCRGADGDR